MRDLKLMSFLINKMMSYFIKIIRVLDICFHCCPSSLFCVGMRKLFILTNTWDKIAIGSNRMH